MRGCTIGVLGKRNSEIHGQIVATPTPSGGKSMPEPDKLKAEKDKKTILSIVKEMTESMTGQQSTKHWSKDALWFDIPAFASRGVQPALKFFDKVFSNFESCKIDILETGIVVNGDMGIVCTVQKINVVLKHGDKKSMFVRETDCFERRAGEWQLIHQHASVPSGGAWDGKITVD
jgi:ketosteroid isomerase-like protein